MSSLPREIIRWLQSLDLPFPVKHPKRDLSNGYLFAEICARYWPNVEMHSFENKHSQKEKEGNWQILRKAFVKNNFAVDPSVVASVIAQDDGFAEHVLQQLYTALTKRQIQQFAPLAAAAVEQAPTFIRTNAPQQAQSPSPQASNSPAPQQAQRSAAEEDARSEAEKRAALARQQARARATQKPQTIKQSDDSATSAAVPIQFAAVQVKPLPANLMSRLGGGGHRDAAQTSEASAQAALLSQQDNVVGLIANQISKVLTATAAPAWLLTTSAPDNATYFTKNLSIIENSLRSIMWSQLTAQTDAVALFLLQRPADYGELVGLFGDLLFARPSAENFSLTYVTSINQAMAAHSPQATLSTCQLFALPPLVNVLQSATIANVDSIVAFLASFLSPRAAESGGYLSHLVSIVYDAICGPAGGPDVSAAVCSTISQRSFLLVLGQLVTRLASKKSRQHHNRSSDGDVSFDDLSSSSLDPVVMSITHYNIVAGLHSESKSVRTAALGLLLAVAGVGEVTLILDHYFPLVCSILGAGGAGGNEDMVLALQLFSVVAPYCFTYASTSASACELVNALVGLAIGEEGVGACASFVKLFALHVLCRTAHFAPSSCNLPQKLMHVLLQDGAAEIRARLFAPGDTATPIYSSATIGSVFVATTHRLWASSVFVDALIALTRGEKIQEPAERRVSLTKTASSVIKTGAVDSAVATRVQFLHLLLVEGRLEHDTIVSLTSDGSGTTDDEDVQRWWANLQALQPDVDFSIYCGELIVAQKAKPAPAVQPPENVASTILHLAALAQHVAARLYIDLSGLHTTPSAHDGPYTEDPQLVHRACQWLRTVCSGQ